MRCSYGDWVMQERNNFEDNDFSGEGSVIGGKEIVESILIGYSVLMITNLNDKYT